MKDIVGLSISFAIFLAIYLFVQNSLKKSKNNDLSGDTSKINTYSKLIDSQFKFAKTVCIVMLILIVLRAFFLFIMN